MSSLGDGTADELAQKYKDKALARKRGAGTHQPKFRGFTLAKKSETLQSTTEDSDLTTTLETTTTAAAATVQLNGSATPTSPIPRFVNTSAAGLAQKYQEKALARKRGAGAHQPEFRGFTLKKNTDNVIPTTAAEIKHVPATVRAGDADTQVPSNSSTSNPNRKSGVISYFDTASRKENDTTSSGFNQQISESTGWATSRLAKEQRPVIEDTVDDVGVTDDFDQNDLIPSPLRNSPDPDAGQEALFDDLAPVFSDVALTASDSISSNDASKRKWRPHATPLSNTVPIALKPSILPTKKRRLIQEEVDENEDPLPAHQNRATEKSKSWSDGLKKPIAAPLDSQGPKDMRLEKGQARTMLQNGSSRKAPALAATTLESTTTVVKTRPKGVKPLRQMTLVQLVPKPVRKDNDSARAPSRGENELDETDGSDSDLDRRLAAPMKSTNSAAPVRSKGQSDTESTRKTVQSLLQIDEAPVSEMEVIAEAVKNVMNEFIDAMDDESMAKEMLTLGSELEIVLIEQVDLLSDHMLLRASVKKAAAMKKELRGRLLETQRGRQKTREELRRVRASFEREERARRRLEETHKFLTDLEALRDFVADSDDEVDNDDEGDDEQEDSNPKTGLQSLIATVGARCGGTVLTVENKDTRPGMLGTLREFNRLLSETERSLQRMPLVTPSQEITSSRRRYDSDDDDGDDDFDWAR
ncbi:hypothetical protein BGZ58_007040 [Dissophora ornata]|nr:hypothetical protein BGZ58_007040 [Dissophora ornata]